MKKNKPIKIAVFLHGTTIMHKNASGLKREEIIKQVLVRDKSVQEFESYIPVGNAPKKLFRWKTQGARISYLSSHNNTKDVKKDKIVLKKYGFPRGKVFYWKNEERNNDIVEKIMPDILIEDDCESIGGKKEMIVTDLKPEIKKKIKSTVTKEFEGIDHLPDNIQELKKL